MRFIRATALVALLVSWLTAPAGGATKYFTPGSPSPTNSNESTVSTPVGDASLWGSNFDNGDLVLIGWTSGGDASSTPYPFEVPAAMIVNVVDGGLLVPDTSLQNGSTLNFSGTAGLRWLEVSDTSTVNMTGGTMALHTILFDQSHFSMTEGRVGYLQTVGQSSATISGGTVSDLLQAGGESTITVTAGTIHRVIAEGDGHVILGAGVSVEQSVQLEGTVGSSSPSVEINGATIAGGLSADGSGGTFPVAVMTAGTIGGDVALSGAGLLALGAGSVNGNVSASGGEIDILSASVLGNLTASGGATIVAGGGTVGGIVSAEEGSTVTTAAAVTGGAFAFDGTVNVHGGSIGGDLRSTGHGRVEMSGGNVVGSLSATGTSVVNVTGGSIAGGATASNTAFMTLAGGSFGSDVQATGLSTVVINGANISNGGVLADGQAHLLLQSGRFGGGVASFGSSHAIFSGGSTPISFAQDSAILEVNGVASIDESLSSHGFSTVTLGGGATVAGTLDAYDSSTINMIGGVVVGVATAHGNSVFNYSGGVILGGAPGNSLTTPQPVGELVASDMPVPTGLSGVSILGLTAYDSAVVNIIGTNLGATLVDANYAGMFSQYQLTGLLADGTPVAEGLTFLVQNGTGASYAFLAPPVPEPAGLVFLAGLALVGPLSRRARR